MYKGVMDVFRRVHGESGLRGLYRGVGRLHALVKKSGIILQGDIILLKCLHSGEASRGPIMWEHFL